MNHRIAIRMRRVLDNLAALHHKRDMLHYRDVAERIALDRDHIRKAAGLAPLNAGALKIFSQREIPMNKENLIVHFKQRMAYQLQRTRDQPRVCRHHQWKGVPQR